MSENPDIKPVRDNIPIAKLASHQKIRLEAYARLGRGKTHAKWQPVSMCTYQNLPKIKIDANRCDACGKCVDVCFKGILANVGKSIETRNIIQCALCEDCVDACPQSPPAIDVTWDKNSFVFNVESTGALPVERILMEALKILDKKFLDFQDTIKEVL